MKVKVRAHAIALLGWVAMLAALASACEDEVVWVPADKPPRPGAADAGASGGQPDGGGQTPAPGSGISSCDGHCGATFEDWDECACDGECAEYDDCCPDYEEFCGDGEPTPGPDPSYSFPDPLALDELSHGDCRGWATGDSSRCDTSDCVGIVKESSSSCTTDDCRGIARMDAGYCRSALCKGVASEDVTLCESADCRGMVTGSVGTCSSSQCKAIVGRDPSRCPE